MMVGSFRTLTFGLCLSCAFSSVAHAERSAALPRRARLLLPVCPEPPFDHGELVSTLRVELLDHGTELRPTESPGDLYDMVLITVESPSCTGEYITVRIQYPSTERSVSRALDLGEHAPQERGRIMALAAAELLRDAWPELSAIREVTPEPEAEPAPPREPPRIRQVFDPEQERAIVIAATLQELERRRAQAEPEEHRVELTATLLGRSYPSVYGGAIGGRLGVSILLSRSLPLHLEIDGAYTYDRGTAELGEITAHSALGGLALLVQSSAGRVRGSIGVRLELGWTRAGWQPTESTDGSGEASDFVLTTALAGGARIRLGGRLWITLAALIGWVAVPLEYPSEASSLGGIGHLLLGADVGIAIGL